jgi:hypothetical protein
MKRSCRLRACLFPSSSSSAAAFRTRPLGAFSAIESYAPDSPCNGWYELLVSGQTDYQECTTTSDCDGARQDEDLNEVGEHCRFGFCEAY